MDFYKIKINYKIDKITNVSLVIVISRIPKAVAPMLVDKLEPLSESKESMVTSVRANRLRSWFVICDFSVYNYHMLVLFYFK